MCNKICWNVSSGVIEVSAYPSELFVLKMANGERGSLTRSVHGRAAEESRSQRVYVIIRSKQTFLVAAFVVLFLIVELNVLFA